jgi:hypothetical protein
MMLLIAVVRVLLAAWLRAFVCVREGMFLLSCLCKLLLLLLVLVESKRDHLKSYINIRLPTAMQRANFRKQYASGGQCSASPSREPPTTPTACKFHVSLCSCELWPPGHLHSLPLNTSTHSAYRRHRPAADRADTQSLCAAEKEVVVCAPLTNDEAQLSLVEHLSTIVWELP